MNISRMLVFFLRLARPGAISLLFHPAHLQIAKDWAGGVPGKVVTLSTRDLSAMLGDANFEQHWRSRY